MKGSFFRFIKGVGITFVVIIGMTFVASLVGDFTFKNGVFNVGLICVALGVSGIIGVYGTRTSGGYFGGTRMTSRKSIDETVQNIKDGNNNNRLMSIIIIVGILLVTTSEYLL
jgi:hypothetical protein